MTKRPLISHEELLGGGLSGRVNRQASAIFLMIEARTAQLVADQRSVNTPYMTTGAHRERNLAYLQAIVASVPPPARPATQNLERMVPRWADLVPDNPVLRAALAKKLGEEHSFTRKSVPRIVAALDLADADLMSAFKRQIGAPIDSLMDADLRALDRVRWT